MTPGQVVDLLQSMAIAAIGTALVIHLRGKR